MCCVINDQKLTVVSSEIFVHLFDFHLQFLQGKKKESAFFFEVYSFNEC